MSDDFFGLMDSGEGQMLEVLMELILLWENVGFFCRTSKRNGG